jgi:hypothetical protein
VLRADAREGDIGMKLGEVPRPILRSQSAALRSSIRSNTNVVLAPAMQRKLAQAKRAIEDMRERRQAQSNS